jgi:alpha-galactosidase
MDVDETRLQAIGRLCRRYSDETGAGIETVATTERRAALAGADFVINTALVAGYDQLRAGWAIAARHGYRHGGSLHVMHDEPFWINAYQLRFFDEVVRDVRELCPAAWYLQVANPVLAGMTWLGRRYPDVTMIGLCHGFAGVYRVADALGLDHERLTFEIPGVNHTVFLTHAYHDGHDVFPLLDAWIEREAPSYWETCPPSDYLGPVPVDVYRRFGVFPIGDTCNPGGGSWPWWYHTDEATERRWHEDPTAWWQRHFARGTERVAEIERAAGDDARPVSEVFPPVHSGEVMVPLIEAAACDLPRVLIGNVLNGGDFVPGLPRDFAVEIPVLVSKRGIEGIQTRGLPDAVLAQIWRDRVGPVTIELAAYAEGSRERLLELVLTDPWTRSLEQAEAMLDEIFAMPEHAALREWYR